MYIDLVKLSLYSKIAELVGLVQDAVVKGRNLGLGTRRRRAFRQLLKANLSSTLFSSSLC